MTALVENVLPKGDKGAAIMGMTEGPNIWTPNILEAQKLVGKPIPQDWTLKEGEYGPQAFPPREKKSGFGGGAPAAYRNTKEGQFYEQERMDRRTALMQAVELSKREGMQSNVLPWPEAVTAVAEHFNTWLRQTSGASSPGNSSLASGTSSPETSNGSDPAAGESSVAKGVAGASQSLSNGEGGGGGGQADGEAASATSLDLLQARYGSLAKALKAARVFYDAQPPNSITDLTESQIQMLLLEVADA